jgi:AbrB-like transcriptional regulator
MAKTTVKSDPKQSEKSKSGSTSSATNTDRSVEVTATIDSSDEGNTPNTPLTGKALLQKVKELSHLAKRETAKQCGYVKSTSSGGVRTDLSGFYDAVLTAKGVKLDETSRDSRGKVATYKATVHKNGQLLIGSAYTKGMGLKEGDTFTIKLGYKHIHLIQDEN